MYGFTQEQWHLRSIVQSIHHQLKQEKAEYVLPRLLEWHKITRSRIATSEVMAFSRYTDVQTITVFDTV